MAAPAKYQEAEITWRKDHAPDLWSIRVRTAPRPDFQPGQYVSLGLEADGKVVERAYSIVSGPHEDELEFFFELVPQGALTPRLHALQPGAKLLLRPRAKGVFTLDRESGRANHFCVSTVTGVAPFVSMARTLAREVEQGAVPGLRMVLLEAASRSWELGYFAELDGLARRHAAWFTYVPAVSRPWEDEAWTGERGRAEDLVRKILDGAALGPGDTTAYVCGHPIMIDNAKGIFLRRGFARDDLRVEVYWMPKKEKAGPA
ncbi:MAG: ferredoxin--NADP reductase [Myxococcales bacterium]